MKEHAYHDWEVQKNASDKIIGNDMEGSAIQTAIFATNAASLGLGKLAGNTVTFMGKEVSGWLTFGGGVSQQFQNATSDAISFEDFDHWVSS